MGDGLKFCPFCGAEHHCKVESRKRSTWRNSFGDAAYYRTYHVRCTVCNARGATVGGMVGDTERVVLMYGKEVTLHPSYYYAEKAIELWNKRANCGGD